jgi:hypothetical protein
MLKENPEKIIDYYFWSKLSANESAIELLKDNQSKIDWEMLIQIQKLLNY